MVEFKYLHFCGYCAGDLTKESDTVYRCVSCSKPTFNGPVAAAGVLIFKDDAAVLLAVRAIAPHKGMLDIIGGFLDFGEQPEAGIRREFLEETGGMLADVRLFDARTAHYTENITPLDLIYIGDIKDNSVLEARDDVAELRWVAVSQLQDEQFGSVGIVDLIQRAYHSWEDRRKS